MKTEGEECNVWYEKIGLLYPESTLKDLVHCPPERDLTDWLKAMDAVCSAASGVLKQRPVTTRRNEHKKEWVIRGQLEADALDQALNRLLPH